MSKDGFIDSNSLRRKGKRKKNNHIETRGKINICQSIHDRNKIFEIYKQFGHFKGDIIVGKKRKSVIVTISVNLLLVKAF